MTVKKLIEELQKCSPKAKVTYCTAAGDSSGYVKGVDKTLTKYGATIAICLDCIGTHAFGEKL